MNSTSWVPTYIASAIQDFPRKPASEFSRQLYLYACPIIVILGLVGNFMSFLIMCTKQMRTRSYTYYLAALSVYDSAILLFSLVVWINVVVYYHEEALVFTITSRAGCAISEYIFDVLYIASSWSIVAVTCERFVIVTFPIRGREFTTPKVAVIAVIMIAACACAAGSFHLVATMYDPTFGCYYTGENRGIAWVRGSTLVTYLPFAIILILNGAIVIIMHRTNKLLSTDNRKTSNIRKVTGLVLSVSTVFLACLFPMGFLSSMVAINPNSAAQLGTAFDIARLVLSINNAVNFYIYVLTGHEIRHALKADIFGPCFKAAGRDYQVSTVSGSTAMTRISTVDGAKTP